MGPCFLHFICYAVFASAAIPTEQAIPGAKEFGAL